MFVDLMAVFAGRSSKKFHTLGQGFVPLGQSIQTFIDCHRLPRQECYALPFST
jgi:hypothetical protein